MKDPMTCDHSFQHLRTTQRHEDAGYNICWIQVDEFFCTKCLHEQSKTKKEYSRDTPIWWERKR